MKTLVFIHGWASSPEVWYKQKEYFKKYNILLPELDLDNLKDNADKIYSLCKGKGNLAIIAWSMGWLVTLKLMEYFPLDIKALVSICGTPKFISEDYLDGGIRRQQLRALRLALKKDFTSALNRFYQQHRIPLRAENFLNKKELWIKQLDILEKEDLRKNLSLIECPTLFITGQDDMLSPISLQNYMSNYVKNSVIRVVEFSAHAPFIDNSKEINNFIKGTVLA
ncbi:MAG: alpha/beta hydrolase [Candidatus Omnitrophica bacterium]|nr:alpha/beta hydrolase [Candidatus Omnitrophota bacterium]MCM8770250.1 alpha/beta hydrolase [Candidatus Omnitrophota bacterium]